jgi:hypothetical protein
VCAFAVGSGTVAGGAVASLIKKIPIVGGVLSNPIGNLVVNKVNSTSLDLTDAGKSVTEAGVKVGQIADRLQNVTSTIIKEGYDVSGAFPAAPSPRTGWLGSAGC